uniref:Tctex1 domain-containing protein 2 n=1 Tax=Tetraselmis sp. GSL018 TaxID=582737 RepID=A0A061RGY2_9CHLO|mmetsp:Transcript_41326/g.98006  ORF Transcript_41326/g.98006 Transcript_41326/m.98006 type:complete len:121 (+) Transcript_41326:196-558(+)
MTDAKEFAVEPSFTERFKPNKARQVMQEVLKQKLSGVSYHADNTSNWAREISDEIKSKLKDEGWKRYKFVVQVVIGEQRGQGTRMGCRCFWDNNTDSCAHEVFHNESLFCVAAAYGVYLY